MEKLYEEIVGSKQEIKNAIEASEVRLLLKIESFNEKIKKLEHENSQLKQQVEILEKNSKKNNIIVFGLTERKEDVTLNNICDKLNSALDLEITPSDIGYMHSLGRSENSPIKIEFLSTFTKIQVLQNCRKLKGTNISISSDLTKKQQENIKILRQYLKKLRLAGEDYCYIKGEKLYRNNIGYTAENILEIEKNIETLEGERANSAPETPSRNNNFVVISPEIKKKEDYTDTAEKKEEEEEEGQRKKSNSTKRPENTQKKLDRERKNSTRDIQLRSGSNTHKNSK